MEEISLLSHVSVFDSGLVFLWKFPFPILILGITAVLLLLLPVSNTGLSLSLQGFGLTELPRFGFSK